MNCNRVSQPLDFFLWYLRFVRNLFQRFFNEIYNYYHSSFMLLQKWKDPRFTWSPAEYEGLETIHLPNEKIWKPDLEVLMSA